MKRSTSGDNAANGNDAGTALLVPAYILIPNAASAPLVIIEFAQRHDELVEAGLR
jgi:hypothetical protein